MRRSASASNQEAMTKLCIELIRVSTAGQAAEDRASLRYMRPSLSRTNVPYAPHGESVQVSDSLVSKPVCPQGADSSDLFVCNWLGGWSYPSPSLLRHVNRVVFMCPEKQVIGSYARRVIAFVTDEHSFWDRPVVNLPRDARDGFYPSLPVCYDTHRSVSGFARRFCPEPTSAGFLNARPESFRYITASSGLTRLTAKPSHRSGLLEVMWLTGEWLAALFACLGYGFAKVAFGINMLVRHGVNLHRQVSLCLGSSVAMNNVRAAYILA